MTLPRPGHRQIISPAKLRLAWSLMKPRATRRPYSLYGAAETIGVSPAVLDRALWNNIGLEK